MKFKFGIKEVVATGIGTALFVALTQVQIPMGFIPNTSLQPRAALLAFLAALFQTHPYSQERLCLHSSQQCLARLLAELWDLQDMRSETRSSTVVYGGAGYSRMQYSVF